MKTEPKLSTFPAARKSGSAGASLVAELTRLRGMSVEERIREALSIQQKLQGFKPHPKP
jgi:hypothetical protein